jgi:predicted metal-binding membrane protein
MQPIAVARRYRAPALAVGALALAAWLVLFVWERSQYADYLNHGELDRVAIDGAPKIALFVAGWAVMVAAMMLPTTLPLVVLFASIVRSRATRAQLVVLLLAGYLLVWIGFGLLVYGADLAVHRLAEYAQWLHDEKWAIAAATFALAGLYQFSRLKYRCQHQCRSPRMFLVQRWHGGEERRRAWKIGVEHGLFCVGCCWTLMLVMFALGTFSLGWMLLVGAVMAVEKNFPHGQRLRTPLGAGLLVLALTIAAVGIARQPSSAHHHHGAGSTMSGSVPSSREPGSTRA